MNRIANRNPAREPKATRRPAAAMLLSAAAAALALALTDCAGPGYYYQAAAGHLSLMRKRQDLDEIIGDAATDPTLAQELALAAEIRRFAIDALDLPDNDSFTEYVSTGRKAVVWNVVAAPEFSIEPRQWCFMVSGCVPYRGYFDEARANQFAGKMARKSFDVSVSPAIAYSTLGWFSDPLLDTMFQYSDARLAGFIFHELAHQKLYVKGDTDFNEAYATFVEQLGVEQWLAATRREDQLAGWQSMEAASKQFNALLRETREALRAEYGSGRESGEMRENKKAIIEGMRSRYALLVDEAWSGRDYFGSWFAGDLNNANLALMNSYQGGECAFAGLYGQAEEDIRRFHELAAEIARAETEARRLWLDEPC